jgi:hypothetical protein
MRRNFRLHHNSGDGFAKHLIHENEAPHLKPQGNAVHLHFHTGLRFVIKHSAQLFAG